jgi:hypothetical protein
MIHRLDEQDYRDDRMYVMRISSDFKKSRPNLFSAPMSRENQLDKSGSILLITYRNIKSLPAVRVDEFSSWEECVVYIKKHEPTCPRISLEGQSPSPTPSWQDHLSWLDSLNLSSVLDGDNPIPEWVQNSRKTHEFFQVKRK